MRLAERDRLRLDLREKEIQTAIHYPIPVHLQRAYCDVGYGAGDLPATKQVADELHSVPTFSEMKDSQIEQVCNVVRERMQ